MLMYKEKEILDWAEDRGILEKGDRLTQGLKTAEEIGELISNILKGNSIVDDLGDIYVTIVIQASLNGFSLDHCRLQESSEPILEELSNKELLAMLLQSASLICSDAQDTLGSIWSTVSIDIAFILAIINKMAADRMLSLEECIDHSYGIISDRTGEMVDGVYRKD